MICWDTFTVDTTDLANNEMGPQGTSLCIQGGTYLFNHAKSSVAHHLIGSGAAFLFPWIIACSSKKDLTVLDILDFLGS